MDQQVNVTRMKTSANSICSLVRFCHNIFICKEGDRFSVTAIPRPLQTVTLGRVLLHTVNVIGVSVLHFTIFST